MADPVNGGSNPAKPSKEMSMEVRLLLAFLLMGVVMFVFNYLTPQPPPANTKKQTPAAEQKAAPPQTAATQTPAAPAAAAPPPAARAASTPVGPATTGKVEPP